MRFACISLLIVALGLSGCAGYRLGPTNGRTAGAQSVQVKPFLNHSAEPGLADDLTSALRQSVQEDGTFHLTTDGSSDLIVNGTITDYRRRELSLLSEDIRTVRDYQVSLIVHVIVTERASGRAVLERDVKGGTLVRVADDLAATERQAAPILTRDLARQITHLIVDGEW